MSKFRHYKNGKLYTKENLECKIQLPSGEWVEATIYKEVGQEQLYVRTESEFNLKFKQIC
jgi:hypothetical protein